MSDGSVFRLGDGHGVSAVDYEVAARRTWGLGVTCMGLVWVIRL